MIRPLSASLWDVDGYDFWRRALALTGGKRSLTRDEMQGLGLTHDPGCGFFRRRVSRAGAFVPVAIWNGDAEMVALQDGRRVDASEVWTYCAAHPITEELYHQRMNGGRWPDEDEAVTASLTPAPHGHNQPPRDEAEVIAGQIAAASANAKEYETINDDETAAKAQSCRSRLNELSGQADKRREALKKPHLEAGREIDAKWQPLVKTSKAAADAIAKALSAHETRKARAAAESARKAEAERQAAESARQSALREQLAKHPDAPIESPPPPPNPEPAPVAQPTQIRGLYGRAAGVKAVRIAKVTNYELAVPFFATNHDIRALVDKLAQKTVDSGVTPPGVEVTEEMRVS